MGLFTFKGGIHPNDGKSLAKDKPIASVLPSGDMVYPLSQHIGAPATPIVAVGDEVLVGQKIAEAGGFVSAPIHASVSGTVIAIEPRRHPNGKDVLSVVIENDFKDTMDTTMVAHEDYSKLSDDEIKERIANADLPERDIKGWLKIYSRSVSSADQGAILR